MKNQARSPLNSGLNGLIHYIRPLLVCFHQRNGSLSEENRQAVVQPEKKELTSENVYKLFKYLIASDPYLSPILRYNLPNKFSTLS